ncbi:thiolase domain-containing protein [Halolamina salifodinae]|uniref:Acetyl-CoA C-acetyltransferase n=1 Tax=Halolamina salifodinae TaxID=1202767 RepID=A0A8T4GWT6_9EURY|nr:thiolase domain-containing protein [Halolamina salifodinae]MBP1986920.1 acetyl-CoA C-acetyltransferase [Halolamina salifodinae]
MSGVRVAGVGLTHFGSHPERTGRDLFAEAALAAKEDAGVPLSDVEQLNVGNFAGPLSEGQGHLAPLLAEAAGLTCPATRYEEACASAGVAVREGVRTVRSGEADVVLAGGVERMTNHDTPEVTESLAIAADELFEVRAGVTFPAAYALMATAYADAYGVDEDDLKTDLANVASKNHDNAIPNEYAQYQRELTVEQALDAPPVAEPLALFDCCPITDGASAIFLVSEEYAAEHDLDAGVSVVGTGQGADRMALQDREHLARTPAADDAAAMAYDDAGIDAADVDVAEVHDCFTIAEVLAIESLGFYDPGEGLGAARRGETRADGDLPINLSGGLKAKGHPVGATGGSQIAEMTRLLRGDHPNSDKVDDAEVGVTHNAGGTVASAVVHVLEVAE